MDKTMEDKKIQEHPDAVPYIVHESEMARQERNIRRLLALCILIFVAFVVSNVCWIVYENSFEDIVMTQEATTDGGGNATVNGATGDLNYYGESETDDQNKTP